MSVDTVFTTWFIKNCHFDLHSSWYTEYSTKAALLPAVHFKTLVYGFHRMSSDIVFSNYCQETFLTFFNQDFFFCISAGVLSKFYSLNSMPKLS